MKNIIQTISAAILLGIVLTCCGPTIHYLGNQFEPTHRIDIYFDENDIENEYIVIGTMKNEGEQWIRDVNKIKEAMIAEAKAKGADAILFVGTYSEQISSVQSGEYSRQGNSKEEYTFNSAHVQRVKVLEAKVLKYQPRKCRTKYNLRTLERSKPVTTSSLPKAF